MDGVKIRNDDVQNCLAALIYNSHVNDGVNHCNNEVHHNERVIRLVASVDNVDACTFLSNKFAWVSFIVTLACSFFLTCLKKDHPLTLMITSTTKDMETYRYVLPI